MKYRERIDKMKNSTSLGLFQNFNFHQQSKANYLVSKNSRSYILRILLFQMRSH